MSETVPHFAAVAEIRKSARRAFMAATWEAYYREILASRARCEPGTQAWQLRDAAARAAAARATAYAHLRDGRVHPALVCRRICNAQHAAIEALS